MGSVIRVDHFIGYGGGRADGGNGRDSSRNDPARAEQARRDDTRSERRLDGSRRADFDIGGASERAAATERARSLDRLIECEIIPRLLVAHAAPPRVALDAVAGRGVSAADVAAFAPLALQVEADELLDHVEGMVAHGVSLETVLVDLLAPAARLLGQYWEDDRCDFVDVTMGLWRLQEVVHELAGRALPLSGSAHSPRRALFASLEGDQHSFGTVVVDELFCANGWLTDRLNATTTAALLERVRGEWFDLAGLTITCDCHIESLPSIVRGIRTASRNPRICVMVGGRVCVANPDLAATVGADGTAPDARVAVRVAGELVEAVARETVASMTG